MQGDCLAPDLRCQLVKWLQSHAYLGIIEKDLNLKIRQAVSGSTKPHDGVTNDSDSVAVSVSDVPYPVAVKSVPPRRRTKSNIRILKDSNLLSSSDNTSAVDNTRHVVLEEADESAELSLADVLDKASRLIWILLFFKYQKFETFLCSFISVKHSGCELFNHKWK